MRASAACITSRCLAQSRASGIMLIGPAALVTVLYCFTRTLAGCCCCSRQLTCIHRQGTMHALKHHSSDTGLTTRSLAA